MPSLIHNVPVFDSTRAILRDGYQFIWDRCRRLNTGLFATRVMGHSTICIHGREAAQLFHDEEKLQRESPLIPSLVSALIGEHAVQTGDDAGRRRREQALVAVTAPERLDLLMEMTAQHWQRAIRRWEHAREVVLFDEAQRVLTASVFEWVGIPVPRSKVRKRARQLAAMTDAFGGGGPRLWQGRLARARTEGWLARWVLGVRSGRIRVDPRSLLAVMANHRDQDGELLSPRAAAAEILGVTAPTAAIARHITFAALALHRYPHARARLVADLSRGHSRYLELFVQEVRRFYPLTPHLGARVRAPFRWRGQDFKVGTLVLLDVYGTDHDPQLWESPGEFRPERFLSRTADTDELQGDGLGGASPRDLGAWITLHNLSMALLVLTHSVTYEVVFGQDLSFDLGRVPTRPRSGFVMSGVRSTHEPLDLVKYGLTRRAYQDAYRDTSA